MINSNEFYNGYCLIRWSLKIFECFGLKKAIFLDRATKICFGRNTNDEISLSLILKLANGKTYYENFGFIPSNNTTNIDTFKKINMIANKLRKIGWDDIKFEKEENKKIYQKYREKYSENYITPFSAFENFVEKDCKYFYDFLSIYSSPLERNLPCKNDLFDLKLLIGKKEWYLNLDNIIDNIC